jgi:hypothetical protein
MPSNELVEKYGNWFVSHLLKSNSESKKKFDLVIPSQDLYKLDHEVLVAHKTSYLWRFRPSALVVELDTETSSSSFHILVAVSNAIALKDVGELNCYTRIMGATSGCVISPKGISNEVRLVQAESSIRDRLFGPTYNPNRFLVQWDTERNSVVAETVIPIEAIV